MARTFLSDWVYETLTADERTLLLEWLREANHQPEDHRIEGMVYEPRGCYSKVGKPLIRKLRSPESGNYQISRGKYRMEFCGGIASTPWLPTLTFIHYDIIPAIEKGEGDGK